MPNFLSWAISASFLLPQLLASDNFFGENSNPITCDQPPGVRFETEGTWVLDGTELNVSNTQKYVTDRMRLTIRDLQFSDEGNYTCVFVQDGQHFVSLGDVLRIVGTPVFSTCNQSNCTERICSTFSSPVSLDLGIVFINSVSTTEGPLPHRTDLCRIENTECAPLIRCIRFAGCDVFDPAVMFTRASSTATISNISPGFRTIIYTTMAVVREPAGAIDRVLTKNITVTLRNCSNLQDPPGGSVSVDGCLATYNCHAGDLDATGGDVVLECLESSEWNGTEASCLLSTSPSTSTSTTLTTATSPSATTSRNLATFTSTVESSNEETVVIISLSIILPTAFLLLMALIIGTLLLLFWKLEANKKGKEIFHTPSAPEIIIPNLAGHNVTIKVEHRVETEGLRVKEGVREGMKEAEWRQSALSTIDCQVDLPDQDGEEEEAHV